MKRWIRGLCGALVFLLAAVGFGQKCPTLQATFDGVQKGGYLGCGVCWVGDVDGDGIGDVLASPLGGKAVLASGRDGATIYTLEFVNSFQRGQPTVAGLGDIDGDDVPDFAVGSDRGDESAGDVGKVTVYSGADGSVIQRLSGYRGAGHFGASVACAGDVDADGTPDLIVGTGNPGVEDIALVFSGADFEVLYTFQGTYAWDGCHSNVAGAGDVNQDGYDDFIVGAAFWDSPEPHFYGKACVFSGKDGSTLYTFEGEDLYTDDSDVYFAFGGGVCGGQDVDGDGYPDICVAAESFNQDSYGAVVVYSGVDGSTLYTFTGEGAKSHLGRSLSMGDVNGDGHADILAGGLDGAGSTNYVFAFSGADGSSLFSLEEESSDENYGFALDASKDADGDGQADVVVGAASFTPSYPSLYHAGRVYVYLMPCPSGTVTIDTGAVATRSRSVSLGLTWVGVDVLVSEMRLRDESGEWGDWEDVVAKRTWTLPSGEGPHTVEVQFRDESGCSSAVAGDSIVLDQSRPFGEITVENGIVWTNTLAVGVEPRFEDAFSGVSHVRLRNQGGSWGGWMPVAASLLFELTAGNGQKTVEAQAMDFAGNESTVAADSIGLDQTPPTGSVSVDGGAEFTGTTFVTLKVSASDEGGSGLAAFRVKQTTTASWDSGWLAMRDELPCEIRSGEGSQSLDAQFMDGAGNVSAIARDAIILDRTAPIMDALTVNGGRPYVLPREDLELVVDAHDAPGGSGVASFRYTLDGGATFSEWIALSSTNRVTVKRPEASGGLVVRAMAMDTVGNKSSLWPAAETHLVEVEPLCLGPSGTFGGRLADRRDIDAVTFDLARGDLLTIKVKSAAIPDRKAFFPLVLDLARPDGERLVTGIGAAGLTEYAAPETGRYVLVVREEGEGAEQGEYSLAVCVKPAKTNAKGKGTYSTGEIVLDAVEGSSLKAGLKGPDLDPITVVVEGPEGAVAAVVTGKPGSAKIVATLGTGTGTYRIRFIASGPVLGSFALARPKGRALVEP